MAGGLQWRQSTMVFNGGTSNGLQWKSAMVFNGSRSLEFSDGGRSSSVASSAGLATARCSAAVVTGLRLLGARRLLGTGLTVLWSTTGLRLGSRCHGRRLGWWCGRRQMDGAG
ncbi:hypothetical protein Dimus_011496 [Dionaea muscipula]